MHVEDAIHIDAPLDVVWAVTTDVERWPAWTPTVTSVRRVDDGPFGLGSVVRIKQPAQPAAEWTVSAWVPGARFVWGTQRTGLQIEAAHELFPDGAGTRNVLRVEASGALAVLLGPLLRPLVRRALRQENQGLKARCEAIAGASPTPATSV